MNIVSSVNNSLTLKELLYVYQDYNTETLLNKLSDSSNLIVLSKDNVLDTFDNLISLVTLNNEIYTSMLNTIDILKAIPVVIKINFIENDVIFFINDKLFKITKTLYNNTFNINNHKKVRLDLLDENNIYSDNRKCLNRECYLLYTTMYHIRNFNIPSNDLKSTLDLDSDIRFLHVEVPTIYINEIINNIHNYTLYFSNTKTYTDTWVDKSFLINLFNKKIVDIKNNRIRNFVFSIQESCHIADINNLNEVYLKECYKKISIKLNSEYNNIRDDELLEDFPELSLFDDYDNVEMTRLTIIGNKSSLNITELSVYDKVNDILRHLNDNL